jgi:hypothetical protein
MKKWILVLLFSGLFVILACSLASNAGENLPPGIHSGVSVTEVVSLSIFPQEVMAWETITVTAQIKNAGSTAYEYRAALTVDGTEVKRRNVAVPGQSTATATFQLVKGTPGTYQIGVGNKTSAIKVKENPQVAANQPRIVIFRHENTGRDILTILPFCAELGFYATWGDYSFINNRPNFFDKEGRRKFDLLFFAGGESDLYFSRSIMPGVKGAGPGIDESGYRNIQEFLMKGGSCIASCISGPAMFAETIEWIGIGLDEAQTGKQWVPRMNRRAGHMSRLYDVKPLFRGTVRGPQETNQPYPLTRFLPIKLNMEALLVKKTHLPETVYLCIIGSGSLIPNRDAPMEVIGWFPNGTAAMGIVKYGEGHLYLIAPHPSMTMENSGGHIRNQTMGTHAKRWGWTEYEIKKAQALLDREGDPDGPDPDSILMKAILQDAAERALNKGK